MVTALVDTSVIVDLLRGYQEAQTWLQTTHALGVSRMVLIEVLDGAPSRAKQREVFRLFKLFTLIETSVEDLILGTQLLTKFGPSHNVDDFDALIAASAYRLQIPLLTRNYKHFVPMLNDLAQIPYR